MMKFFLILSTGILIANLGCLPRPGHPIKTFENELQKIVIEEFIPGVAGLCTFACHCDRSREGLLALKGHVKILEASFEPCDTFVQARQNLKLVGLIYSSDKREEQFQHVSDSFDPSWEEFCNGQACCETYPQLATDLKSLKEVKERSRQFTMYFADSRQAPEIVIRLDLQTQILEEGGISVECVNACEIDPEEFLDKVRAAEALRENQRRRREVNRRNHIEPRPYGSGRRQGHAAVPLSYGRGSDRDQHSSRTLIPVTPARFSSAMINFGGII